MIRDTALLTKMNEILGQPIFSMKGPVATHIDFDKLYSLRGSPDPKISTIASMMLYMMDFGEDNPTGNAYWLDGKPEVFAKDLDGLGEALIDKGDVSDGDEIVICSARKYRVEIEDEHEIDPEIALVPVVDRHR